MKTKTQKNPKKGANLTIRLDDELSGKLEKACEITGFDRSKIMRQLLLALTTALEEEGEIMVPVRISLASTPNGARRLSATPEPKR